MAGKYNVYRITLKEPEVMVFYGKKEQTKPKHNKYNK